MPRETKRPQAQQETELPELTHKQMGFVRGLLQGLTASDAYRANYNTDGTPDEQIWVRAAELKANRKVSVWLSEARLQCLESTTVTLESHTRELESLRLEARQAGAYGAAIKAEELKGRANGLYVDQIKTVDDKTDVLEALRAIAAQDSTLARSLGSLLNVSESDIMGNDNSSTGPESKLTH